MPSSLVFAALAVAWIVVLVPMVARRRQEVRRTADSALAARVLRRGDAHGRPEEVNDMAEDDTYDAEYDADEADEVDGAEDADGAGDADDEAYQDEEPYEDELPVERPFRPGRGGFDPQAAELAARAKYAYRQRVVLALLVLAVVTALLGGLAMPVLWWVHGAADIVLVSYLVYLRRQVRIELEIRQRRLARSRGRRGAARELPASEADHDYSHRPASSFDADTEVDTDADADADADLGTETELAAEPVPPVEPRPRLAPPPRHPGAAVVELDDEDPGLCDLPIGEAEPYRRPVADPEPQLATPGDLEPYRRAAGE